MANKGITKEQLNRPFFSILMPTYNSEKTITYSLESIKNQTIDKSEIELLVIDGGSKDNTIEIAKKYGATILQNHKRLPEYAKLIGTKNAKGHFIIRMDSDEEFTYVEQLKDRMTFLKKNPNIKVLLTNSLISGRKEICGISSDYMNAFGDPFSYFVYKTKSNRTNTYRHNVIEENENNAVMKFDKDDILPLADGDASCLSLDYLKENFSDFFDNIDFTCAAFDYALKGSKLCGCIKKDIIKHNSTSSFKSYMSKLKFRVINNIYHKDESGFSSREILNSKLKNRKYLFCIYAAIIPLPILDSIKLGIKYKNWTYLLHFIYLYYVCLEIICHGFLKIIGVTKKNTKYGDK